MEFLQFSTSSGCEEPQTRFIECRGKDDKLIRFTANDIVDQGKCLCGQYIRNRLRRRGIMNRKVLQRLRTHGDAASEVAPIIQDVFPVINGMGEVLERMHPKVYTNVARQLSCAPFGELCDGDAAAILLSTVARNLFKSTSKIDWSRIISFFAVAGGLATDCVRQGHYDYLPRLVEVIPSIIDEYLLEWLMEHGGWLGLIEHTKAKKPKDHQFLNFLSVSVSVLTVLYCGTKVLEVIVNKAYEWVFETGLI